MLLELRTILTEPGASLPFETSLDLHEMSFGGCKPLTELVMAKGQIRNTAGVLELRGEVWTTMHAVCDRCTAAFEEEIRYPVEAVLTAEGTEENFEDAWVFEIVDGCADLDDILTTALVLNMPSQLLCREDCRGLCFRCGANLNLGSCGCKPEADPRFAALQQLLDRM